MTYEEFDGAVDKFVVEYLLPGLKKPLNLFAVGAMRGTGSLSARGALGPMLELAGVVDRERVDVQKLKAALEGGFAACPELPFAGLKFTRADADALMRYLGCGNAPV